jgi:Uma2 family endonuclease
MSTTLPNLPPTEWTIADVLARLPGFPADRIRVYPAPGTATAQDVVDAEARTKRTCELIDGILVEKTSGLFESAPACILVYFLGRYLDTRNLGVLLGTDGVLEILPGQIRAADVSFICWEQFPGRKLPSEAIFAIAPDLAIEIISEGNTTEEMDRKLHDYFAAGVRLVWYIDFKTRTARAYTAVGEWTEVGPNDSLLGGEVLPGLELPLAEAFARLDGPRQG